MIDPQIEALLAAMADQGFALPDPLEAGPLRAMLDNPLPAPPVETAVRRDIVIPVEGADLPARLYADRDDAAGLVIFFHGGGWVHGTLETHDRLAAAIAKGSGCAVLSVAYRLAPEHPFPTAYDDALAAVRWAISNAGALGAEGKPVALAGDSSGGNLAATVARRLAEDGTGIALQVLLYPAIDGACDTPSYQTGGGGMLTSAQMRWYWEQYMQGADRADARVDPRQGTVQANLAPALVIVAGNDPLHDDGVAYARMLDQAGVRVRLREYPGAIHGFVSLFGMVAIADEALAEATGALAAMGRDS